MYKYHPTREEIKSLGEILVLYLKNFSRYGASARPGKAFWAGFCLFSSAWFAFSYRDGIWGWEGIYKALGVNESKLQPQTRSEGVKEGASWWGLRDRISDEGNKYIGFAFSQGGIPTLALSEHSSWLSKGIDDAVVWFSEWHAGDWTSKQKLADYVKRTGKEATFPKGVDEDIATGLITDASFSLCKVMAAVSGNNIPDKAYQEFLAEFPSCEEFTENQILEALKPAKEGISGKRRELFSIQKFVSLQFGVAEFRTKISLNSIFADLKDLSNLFGVDDWASFFGRRFTIALGDRAIAAVYPSKEGSNIRPLSVKTSTTFVGKQAFQEIRLKLVGKQENLKAPLPLVPSVDLSEPVFFIPERGNRNAKRWKQFSNGDCCAPSSSVLCLLPQGCSLPDDLYAEDFPLPGAFNGWRLVLIDRDCQIENEKGPYLVQLNQPVGSNPDEYLIASTSDYQDELLGTPIYKGAPGIICRSGKGNQFTRVQAAWVTPEGNSYNPGDRITGCNLCVSVIRNQKGRIVKRFRAILIPEKASVTRRLAVKEKNGIVTFKGWETTRIKAVSPEISVEEDGNEFKVICPARPAEQMDSLSVKVFYGTGESHFQLSVPYPRKYASFQLYGVPASKNGSYMTLRKAEGLSAVISDSLGHSTVEFYLSVRPLGVRSSEMTTYHPIPLDPKEGNGEIQFGEFREDVQLAIQLSSDLCDEPAAEVRISGNSIEKQIFIVPEKKRVALNTDSSGFCLSYFSDDTIEPTKKCTLEAVPLFGNTNTAEGKETIGTLTHQQPYVPFPNSMVLGERPWLVRTGPEMRALPFLFQPANSQESDLQLGIPIYRSIAPLWGGTGAGEEPPRKLLSRLLSEPFSNPDWINLANALVALKASEFASLPFWTNADAKTAFTLAVLLDVIGINPRKSFLATVSMINGWRWELSSLSMIFNCIEDVRKFCKASGFSDCDERLKNLLLGEYCQLNWGLKQKLEIIYCQTGIIKFDNESDRIFLEDILGSPWKELLLNSNQSSPVAKILESQIGVLVPLSERPCALQLSQLDDLIEKYSSLLKDFDPEAYQYFQKEVVPFCNSFLGTGNRRFKSPSEQTQARIYRNRILAPLLVCYTWVDLQITEDHQASRRLTLPEMYFYSEALRLDDSRWFATSLALSHLTYQKFILSRKPEATSNAHKQQ